VDKVAFPYRSSGHLELLHVIAESGSWAKYGLDVAYDQKISSADAHALVPTGEVEFVGGNHISPYGYRARGDGWVYLGQTANEVANQLVVRADSEIYGVSDLREKVVGTRGTHPSLNDWLYLRQRGLDLDRDDVAIVDQWTTPANDPNQHSAPSDEEEPLWEWVRDKKVDATFIRPPSSLIAAQHGLRVIDIEPLPMIYFTTISSSLKFVERHPDIVDRFLKGTIEGIHFFKTQPEKTIKIMRERYTNEGVMDQEVATQSYHALAQQLEPKLFPTMAAIYNVHQEAMRKDPDAKRVNPLELWDMHFLRKVDDSGFIAELYGKNPGAGVD
jgi:ABC-type nitrate/sulfonate/bicarbonate transport system substrate-binding protein